jgi:hypothetical protein
MLFESNNKWAVEVSKEVLDWCVSTPEEKTEYDSVHWAMRCIPQPPKIHNDYRKRNFSTMHRSLSVLFIWMDCKDLSDKFQESSPDILQKSVYTIGLLDENGVFTRDIELNKSEIIKTKNLNSFVFSPIKWPRMMVLEEKSNKKMMGVVIIGKWLIDVTKEAPLLVNNTFFEKYKICSCHTINFHPKTCVHSKYVAFLKRWSMMTYLCEVDKGNGK